MSELKAYRIKGVTLGDFHDVYLKSEADKVIAELKAENERLKATPEEIMKEVFDKVLIYPHDMVRLEDAYRLAVSLRKTKRALWLSRAKRAKDCKYKYETWERNEMKKFNWDGDLIAIVSMKARKWRRVEIKCIKKAEEYK